MNIEAKKTTRRAWYHKNKHKPEFKAKKQAYWLKYRETRKIAASEYYFANKDKIMEKYRERMRKDPTRRRANVLKIYGLTKETYAAILEQQNNSCAICSRSFNGLKSRQICLDHCHSTGKFRAVLCFWCNIMLGGAQDNEDTLEKAKIYILKHKNLDSNAGV